VFSDGDRVGRYHALTLQPVSFPGAARGRSKDGSGCSLLAAVLLISVALPGAECVSPNAVYARPAAPALIAGAEAKGFRKVKETDYASKLLGAP
jgi:hypothetical protein